MSPPLVVIDASVALAWYLPDTAINLRYAAAVREAQDEGQIITLVPDVWAAEIAYRLLKTARTRPPVLQVPLAQAAVYIDRFPQRIGDTPRSVVQIAKIATQYHLQGWDALYFDLALRNRALLATLDGGLKTACANFGVTLWSPARAAVSRA